jgi:hypothetical protein
MASKYSLDMTNGPFLKKILRFSLPLVLTGLLQMIYNTADVIVVGRFAGGTALAAVGATGSLVHLILNILNLNTVFQFTKRPSVKKGVKKLKSHIRECRFYGINITGRWRNVL